MTQREGDYTREVQAELRTRCLHLLTKEAFLAVPAPHEQAFEADGPIWWCDKTADVLGPDGSEACRHDCHGPGRTCYEGPLRL